MQRGQRSMIGTRALVGAAAALLLLSASPPVAAQVPGEPPSTSTTTSTTSTTAPPTTAAPPTSAPPPTAPPPPAPPPTLGPLPAVELDPEFHALDAPAEGYADQPPFDPSSNAVVTAELDRARVREAQARADAVAAIQAVEKLRFTRSKLDARFASLRDDEQRLLREAEAAYALFAQRVSDAYIRGNDVDVELLMSAADATEYGTRAALVDAVLEADEAALDGYLVSRGQLTEELDGLRSAISANLRELKAARIGEKVARAELADAVLEVAMWEAGSQVFARGFVFPVRGEATFGDSWGAPRMTGTAYAHWHEGTDVFAPSGTELVAVENGVVSRVNSSTLGGITVYLQGESGIEYYYAHLSGYAPGVVAGLQVRRGDVLGYTGDTGNARGGTPHLHFEVHVGGRPVNPYPILATAYRFQASVRLAAQAGP